MADETTGNNNTDTLATETTASTEETANTEGTLAGGAETSQPEGAPESYDFSASLPEGATLDEETAKTFGELCKGMNLTNDQANEMAKYGYQYAGAIQKQVEAAREQQVTAWGEEAKKALGSKLNETISLCGAGVEAMEKQFPGIRAALNETGAGNRIEIIQAFAELGRQLGEDRGTGSAQGKQQDNMYNHTDWNNL